MKQIIINKNVLYLLLLGGTIGPVLDGIHVYSETLAYRTPAVLRTAIWVFPLFASSAVGIGLSYVLFDQLFQRKKITLSYPFVASGLVVFMIIYFISGFWNTDTQTKTLTLALLSVVFWWIWDRSWPGAFLALNTAVVGCVVEVLIASTGGFYYLKPDISTIPYWLFFLYIPASISVGNLSRKLYQNH
ncbi:MAG TPA: hypothetical protein VNJ01_10495 [Bacteriovoracaceae bacterium]|nr:hypothetical protein [Bacteriovoracaceae bacterium]